MKQKYTPIDCSFHDILLDRATRKSKVELIYNTAEGQKKKQVIIKDVFTKQGEEFLQMSEGEIIRLDQIISVDGIQLINKHRSCFKIDK